jgi:GNAT superfamily N-acetyltransferase
MPTRNEALDKAFEAAKIPGLPRELFKRRLVGWHVYPVSVCGELAGAILHKGAEVHACILPEYRGKWYTRKIYKEVLKPIIDSHGKLTTAVPDSKPWGRDFVEKFGFKQVRYKDGITYYELNRCKYGH